MKRVDFNKKYAGKMIVSKGGDDKRVWKINAVPPHEEKVPIFGPGLEGKDETTYHWHIRDVVEHIEERCNWVVVNKGITLINY